MFGEWLQLPRHNAYMLIGAAGLGVMAMLFLAMLFTKLKAQRATV
jgi:hypothetical protein